MHDPRGGQRRAATVPQAIITVLYFPASPLARQLPAELRCGAVHCVASLYGILT